MAERILKQLELQPHHSAKSRTVRHYLSSDHASPYPQFVTLKIAKFDNDPGFYLYYLTAEGEETDTYHSSMEEALEQAELEFGVAKEEWIDIAAR